MNSKIATLIHRYGERTGRTKKEIRTLKEEWKSLPAPKRNALKNRLIIANRQLKLQTDLRNDIKKNHSLIRHTTLDGTRALWFMSEENTEEAHVAYIKDGAVQIEATSSGITQISHMTNDSFENWWNIALDEPFPSKHRHLLPKIVVPSVL